jgi:hypothetical protein
MGARKAPNPRYTRAERLSAPPIRGARRPKSGSSTRAGRPETAMPATSSTPDGRATRRHGRQQSTTLGGVDAMTAGRTAHRRQSPREPVCSARRSARRPFPSASASPQRSSNTTGRRIPVCGSMTTALRASWAEPPATRSSSATSPCTSPTRSGRGSSTYLPARSTTGTTWSARSWEISRACTCTLGTPGTCALVPRSPANRFGTSYGASPSTVQSSQAWHS